MLRQTSVRIWIEQRRLHLARAIPICASRLRPRISSPLISANQPKQTNMAKATGRRLRKRLQRCACGKRGIARRGVVSPAWRRRWRGCIALVRGSCSIRWAGVGMFWWVPCSICRGLRTYEAVEAMWNVHQGSKGLSLIEQCKHLLAIVLAHYCDKAVCTQVRFDGVVDLLGLRSSSSGSTAVVV
jgi:hypothetical protein